MIPLEWGTYIGPRLVAELVRPALGPCWIWTGARTRNGYGTCEYLGRTAYIHRLTHEALIGPIPDGLGVLHRCDTKACARPEHLWTGTQAENIADMVSKGRQARGEANKRAKLTTPQVLGIRALHALGAAHMAALAGEFGVAAETIRAIVLRKHWVHV